MLNFSAAMRENLVDEQLSGLTQAVSELNVQISRIQYAFALSDVKEVALTQLCIEKGLFTLEEWENTCKEVREHTQYQSAILMLEEKLKNAEVEMHVNRIVNEVSQQKVSLGAKQYIEDHKETILNQLGVDPDDLNILIGMIDELMLSTN